jgi:hypothetical protein
MGKRDSDARCSVDRTRRLGGCTDTGGQAMTQNMWNVFILLGGILLFVTVIGVLDLVARRRQRRDVHRT